MERPRIESIRIIQTVDENPDTSFLGEYTDELETGVIVRMFGEYYEKLTKSQREEIPSRGREFRAFRPYAGGEKPGSKYYRKYGKQDYERMEGLNDGHWQFIGIYAVAELSYSIHPTGHRRIERMESSGLWGIESDCSEYIDEISREQLDDLKEHLEHFNVDVSNFHDMAIDALESGPVYK